MQLARRLAGSSVGASPICPSCTSDGPTGLSASRGSTTATVSWTAPTDTGGSAITGHQVRARRLGSSGAVVSTVSRSASASARGLAVSLTKGRHRFTVAALNAVGEGAQSARSNIAYAAR